MRPSTTRQVGGRHVPRAFGSKFRAITRAITRSLSGDIGHSRSVEQWERSPPNDKTRGQRLLTCGFRGGQGRGRTANLLIFSWRTARLVRRGQTTSGTSLARNGLAGGDPGNMDAVHDVSVRDQSVPKARLPVTSPGVRPGTGRRSYLETGANASRAGAMGACSMSTAHFFVTRGGVVDVDRSYNFQDQSACLGPNPSSGERVSYFIVQ